MPDYTLLSKIKRYKSRADFHVPPQPKKPSRHSQVSARTAQK